MTDEFSHPSLQGTIECMLPRDAEYVCFHHINEQYTQRKLCQSLKGLVSDPVIGWNVLTTALLFA